MNNRERVIVAAAVEALTMHLDYLRDYAALEVDGMSHEELAKALVERLLNNGFKL